MGTLPGCSGRLRPAWCPAGTAGGRGTAEEALPGLSHILWARSSLCPGPTTLPQEHVLGICLALGDHLAHVPHLLVVLLVVVNLVFDVLVLREASRPRSGC